MSTPSPHPVGVAGAAARVPEPVVPVAEVFAAEGLTLCDDTRARLGIDGIHRADGETGSALALGACRAALAEAGIDASELGVLVDYSTSPQEYLVPAWSMTNKLQAELEANHAFTLGFSGGGASSFHVAVHAAWSLLRTDPSLRHALLVGAEVAIPGHRVLHPPEPVTVFGDGASAIVLSRDAAGPAVLGTEVASRGSHHDVSYVAGGAIAHPDRDDLYHFRFDAAKYDDGERLAGLARLVRRLLARFGLEVGDVARFVPANVAADDHAALAAALGVEAGRLATGGHRTHGHLHGTDLVLNYLAARGNGAVEGDYLVLCSHGMGFTGGATLVRA